MAAQTPRVAHFPDSFHEVNGVAHTSRHFEAYARERNVPFLSVRAGSRAVPLERSGDAWSLELPRGFFSIPLEKDLSFDLSYVRHLPVITRAIERFNPTLIHITGPSEIGLLGAAIAGRNGLPLVASWHTNVHEYAARRFANLFRRTQRHARADCPSIEHCAFSIATWFYSQAQILFAPNPQLCGALELATGRPCRLMPRGVDCQLFHPARRTRRRDEGEFVLGYVGRLSVEKNVALLAKLHRELEKAGHQRVKFLIVGHGSEEPWLRRHLARAEFGGVLKGEALARAYANMDLFVFPSHTDTFGNVVLEALASGVPAIVTPDGGPASIVQDGLTGRIATDAEFANTIAEMLHSPEMLEEMRHRAREYALTASWDAVFDGVYAGYRCVLPLQERSSELSRV